MNPDATKFFITYGSNYTAIQDYLHNHPDSGWGAIILTVIQPLDRRLGVFLEESFAHIEKLIFVEQNYSGQLENYLCSRLSLGTPLWKEKISHLRSYNLYPLFEEDILKLFH